MRTRTNSTTCRWRRRTINEPAAKTINERTAEERNARRFQSEYGRRMRGQPEEICGGTDGSRPHLKLLLDNNENNRFHFFFFIVRIAMELKYNAWRNTYQKMWWEKPSRNLRYCKAFIYYVINIAHKAALQ